MNYEHICYTWKHKKAFLKVEKYLLGKNTLSGYLHDSDKLILYLLPLDKETVQNLHRRWSRHHIESKRKKNYIEMVIDWECARYTKPDKPLTAYQTLLKYYPAEEENIMPILEQLRLV